MRKLTDAEVKKAVKALDGWQYDGQTLNAEFEFKDFKDAFSAMQEIAKHAEEINHHPEWTNVYNSLRIKLRTHDAQGITPLDIQLATVINVVTRNYGVRELTS